MSSQAATTSSQKLNAPDNHSMLDIIRERMRPLSIASTETMVSFREAFSRSVPVTNP